MGKHLGGLQVLVVEDEYLLAEALTAELASRGAEIVGPAATVDDALALIDGGNAIEAAVVDVNLGGEMAYAVADRLVGKHIPLVFTTGYEMASLPARFADVRCCQKPYPIDHVVDALLSPR